MTFLTGLTIYTFADISFTRVSDSDEVVPWLYPDLQYTKDPVLGGGKVYLDSGATVAPPLTFRASCLNATDRFNLKNALGSTGTLTSTTGPFSAAVLLFKAIPVNQGTYRNRYVDLGFELLP